MANNKITGKKLEIDDAITSTCITSNQSGNTTRSVLYLLTFVSAISCMALINSFKYGWAQHRKKVLTDSISCLNTQLLKINHSIKIIENETGQTGIVKDSSRSCNCCNIVKIPDSIMDKKIELEERLKTKNADYDKLKKISLENDQRVHIPILGTSMDVNYLGILSGLTFTVLMFLLIFTIIREFKNLKLAFISITKRYDDKSDYEYFVQFYEKDKANGYSEEKDDYVKECNKLRREHHYNFLSMAEIFTMPRYSNEVKRFKSLEKQSSTIFSYFIFLPPLFCQTIILFYDFHTRKEGQALSYDLTLATIMLDAVLWMAITSLTIRCLSIKYKYTELWDDFYSKGYKLDLEDHQK